MLYRAIVSLPESLTPREHRFGERIVFFECEGDDAKTRLEMLLGILWNVETCGWTEDGLIYNLSSEFELRGWALGEVSTGDLRLLEIAWGGERSIHYLDASHVDLFVSPHNRRRLDLALGDAAKVMAGVPA